MNNAFKYFAFFSGLCLPGVNEFWKELNFDGVIVSKKLNSSLNSKSEQYFDIKINEILCKSSNLEERNVNRNEITKDLKIEINKVKLDILKKQYIGLNW